MVRRAAFKLSMSSRKQRLPRTARQQTGTSKIAYREEGSPPLRDPICPMLRASAER